MSDREADKDLGLSAAEELRLLGDGNSWSGTEGGSGSDLEACLLRALRDPCFLDFVDRWPPEGGRPTAPLKATFMPAQDAEST